MPRSRTHTAQLGRLGIECSIDTSRPKMIGWQIRWDSWRQHQHLNCVVVDIRLGFIYDVRLHLLFGWKTSN